jgi:hypothetical protein
LFNVGTQFGTSLSTHISNCDDIGQCWYFAILWRPIEIVQYWTISNGRHFQNGHHNTTQIQHCSISTPFHMWVDYDVPNWFLILKNFYRLLFSNFAILWRPIEIVQCRETIWDIIIYQHIKLWWYRTMLIFCEIVVAILKIATDRNFSISNFFWSPFSKWPPQYPKNLILSDIIKIWYVGR